MEIIDHIDYAPKWVAPPPKPIFRTDLEKQKYWEQEKTYWREGYGEGYARISGMQYFYLTEGTLKDGSDGTIIKPKYRDCDDWIITELHNAFWNLDSHIGLVKRREIGATSIGAGLLPAYTFRMHTSSKFGLTSCDKDRIFVAYNDKTNIFIKNLSEDIRPIFDKALGYKENATKQQIYLNLPFKTKSANGEPMITNADLFAKETSESDDASAGFSGTRMRAAYFDEFPLHKRKEKLLNSSKSCFMKEHKQSGLLFWAGTVEDKLTSESIAELQQLVADSSLLNFKVMFAPAWWGMFMDKYGNSNEKKATEWVMEERERLAKIGDKSYLNAFIKNYPLTLEEIFNIGGGRGWDDYAVDKLNYQQTEIMKERDRVPVPYKIIIASGIPVASPVSSSFLEILEHPKEGIKYIIGVDGIMTSELTQSDTGGKDQSDFCAFVMKGIDPASDMQFAPVAIYRERPKSIEDAMIQCINLLKYYNKYENCKMIGELNAAGEHIIKMAITNGLGRCIGNRRDLSKKGWVDTKKMWFSRVTPILNWQFEAANIYFKKYSDVIWFKALIIDALKPSNRNADVLDAFMACLYGWGTGDLLDEKQEVRRKATAKLLKYVNGKPVWETVEFDKKK